MKQKKKKDGALPRSMRVIKRQQDSNKQKEQTQLDVQWRVYSSRRPRTKPREQKMLKGRLRRVMYHQAYKVIWNTARELRSVLSRARGWEKGHFTKHVCAEPIRPHFENYTQTLQSRPNPETQPARS